MLIHLKQLKLSNMAEAIESSSNLVETKTTKECFICEENFETNKDADICDDCNSTLENGLKSLSGLTDAQVTDQLNTLLSPIESNHNNRS